MKKIVAILYKNIYPAKERVEQAYKYLRQT